MVPFQAGSEPGLRVSLVAGTITVQAIAAAARRGLESDPFNLNPVGLYYMDDPLPPSIVLSGEQPDTVGYPNSGGKHH
ncbi:MAG: hypothetical protein HY680_06225 [Chloroflexi bacterium]|nr:hypothetical protein [Chloroflexota bacterium]